MYEYASVCVSASVFISIFTSQFFGTFNTGLQKKIQ